MLWREMWKSARVLTWFTLLGTAAVALTQAFTEERIAANERLVAQQTLDSLVPPNQRDNDIVSDTLALTEPEALGSRKALKVHRARWQGEAVAAVFEVVAPDGYSGAIKLLVAIAEDGVVIGVRVISHKETPGLGDYIELERSNWILSFDGRSLSNPPLRGWRVKKDGGEFDQVTGATITPRAVVKAVHKCLQYFNAQREQIFSRAAPGGQANEPGG